MTNEEREMEFELIMLSNWTLDQLEDLEKIAKATNAYDNFMKRKGIEQ